MRRRPIQAPESSEIDLAPMLALMVTLIPIMLLSSAFVHIKVIETSLPQMVETIMEENKDIPTRLNVYLKANGSVNIELLPAKSAPENFSVGSTSGKFDTEELNQMLTQIKLQHPNLFRAEIHPDPQVSYAKIVKIIDSMRVSKTSQFTLTSKTGSTVQSNIMFPDVVFGNVLEDS